MDNDNRKNDIKDNMKNIKWKIGNIKYKMKLNNIKKILKYKIQNEK